MQISPNQTQFVYSSIQDSTFQLDRLFDEAAHKNLKTLFSLDDPVKLIKLQKRNFKLSIECKINEIHGTK